MAESGFWQKRIHYKNQGGEGRLLLYSVSFFFGNPVLHKYTELPIQDETPKTTHVLHLSVCFLIPRNHAKFIISLHNEKGLIKTTFKA